MEHGSLVMFFGECHQGTPTDATSTAAFPHVPDGTCRPLNDYFIITIFYMFFGECFARQREVVSGRGAPTASLIDAWGQPMPHYAALRPTKAGRIHHSHMRNANTKIRKSQPGYERCKP